MEVGGGWRNSSWNESSVSNGKSALGLSFTPFFYFLESRFIVVISFNSAVICFGGAAAAQTNCIVELVVVVLGRRS